MKKIFVFIIILCGITFLNAQENQNITSLKGHYIGVKSGLLFANTFRVCNDDSWICVILKTEFNPKIKAGFSGGFTYHYTFNNGLTLGADLIYAIKRIHTTRRIDKREFRPLNPNDPIFLGLPDSILTSSIYQEHYLKIPLTIGYTVGKKLNYFVNAGVVPGISVLLKSRITDTNYYPSHTEVSKYVATIIDGKTFSLNAILETGVGYTLNKFVVYASANGECSILPLDFKSPYKQYYYSFGFNIGVNYKIR